MKQWIQNRYNGLVFGRTKLGEILNSFYSLRLFLKYSFGYYSLNRKENLRSFIIKQYHIIEKGLALPNPRENFGIPKVKVLLLKIQEYETKFGMAEDISKSVRSCLHEYQLKNPRLSDVDIDLAGSINQFIDSAEYATRIGGTKKYTKEDLSKVTDIDFENFVASRSSVRDFKHEKVKISDITKAIEIARHAPSVCNRQNWRFHYYDDPLIKEKLLNLQHGSNGFIESIQGLFIVTSNIEGFTKMEQNQVFVDGGIISMNLVLALHNIGIGSCCLNTCFPYTREKSLKKLGSISPNERLIMMIGIGYWKDDFLVAYSHKKQVEDLLTIH